MVVNIGEKDVPVVYLVIQAFYPDYNKEKHMISAMWRHRNENHKDCSLGNLVVRFL